ncbi:MAG: hypothetical protein NT121_02855 [Chloroflexi bacterium]|nr:hypothetical protein [Chloroflexota bacterium]
MQDFLPSESIYLSEIHVLKPLASLNGLILPVSTFAGFPYPESAKYLASARHAAKSGWSNLQKGNQSILIY